MNRAQRAIIAIAVVGVITLMVQYVDIISIFLDSNTPISDLGRRLLNLSIGTLVGVASVYLGWRGLRLKESTYLRDEIKSQPDLHIEDWYPKENSIRISLSNLGKERAKHIGLTVIAKPWYQYIGPLGDQIFEVSNQT